MSTDAAAASSQAGPLEGLRVVEVGDGGEVAGKLLADAGADVVRVEPPGGARSRHAGPFIDGVPHTERSYSFAAANTSKRGVTLDLARPEAAEVWRRLVGWAEVVLDSSGPGALDALGCGYEAFEERRDLVWCSITPFGLTGPWRDWATTDLVSLALGGPVMSTGYDDHDIPPMRPDGGHAMAISNEYAVSGILAALWMRDGGDGTGAEGAGGQLIDVSVHEAVSATTEGSFPNWEYLRQVVQRQTGRHAAAAMTAAWQYECSDGEYILLMGGGVPREQRVMDRLLDWMDESGFEHDLREPKYAEVVYRDPRLQPEVRRHVSETIGRFVQARPAEEVYRRGQSLHLPWGPVRRPEDNLYDPHWEDRGFWWDGTIGDEERPVRYPGAPYRFTASPVRLRRRPPLLGEHNHEVYVDWLGLDASELPQLARAGVI